MAQKDTMMVLESELVGRCLGGESASFGILVERYRDDIIGFCYHHIGDWQEAQDLAQETFLRAYFDLPALREPAKFGAWLKAIAFRLCQSWHRRRHVTPLPLGEPPACDESGGLESLMMQQALQVLPKAQQQMLTLKYVDGYTLGEIADLLALPVETVRTRLRRARQRSKEVWSTMMQEGFTQRVLEKLELVQMESGLTWPVYACLHALGKDWSLSYVMGITGTAFRLTVDERIDESGPTNVLDWDRWFAMIQEWGFEVSVYNAQLKSFSPEIAINTEEEFRATQAAAWDAVRASLDRGAPAIAWMPVTLEQKEQGIRCEYGLLVGYDNEAGTYQVRLPWREMHSVPWDGFGRADPVNWFNVIVFGKEKALDQRKLERDSLAFAVEHAHSARPGHGFGGYATWLNSLENGRVQSNGSPRIARLLRESREHAAAFLKEIAGHFPDAAADLSEAERQYRLVAQSWEAYVRQFTPDTPGTVKDASKRTAGLEAVRAAYEAEQVAVKALERALATERN